MSIADDQDDYAEPVDLEEEKSNIEDTDDGGAYIYFDEVPFVERDPEHFSNLVEQLDPQFINRLETDLFDKLKWDKKSREKRDEQYADAIKRTGMGEEAPGGADFQGASKVTHPMLTEACVDFGARTIKEMMPPEGPVKSKIVGKVTKAKMDRAHRKVQFMNWQLTEQIPEFADELDKLLPQVPLGGVAYSKWRWDHRLGRPTFEFIPVDDVFLPWAAKSFYSAERRSHVYYMTQDEYERAVEAGDLTSDGFISPIRPQPSDAAEASDKVEGVERSPYNEDGVRPICEMEILYCIPNDAWIVNTDDDPEFWGPYLLKMDDESGKVLGLYRNWKKDDPQRREINWLIEWPCIPWRGAYAIGIPQVASGLSKAATGALRALLDSALINSSATALKLQSAISGQSQQVEVGQVNTVQGSGQVDDIRKLAMPIPFNPPSPVLFDLLGFLQENARGIIRTSLEDLTGEGPNTPVGTVMARVEQGMVVFSSIHKRLHRAMGRCLRTLEDINEMYLDDEVKVKELDLIIRRMDFQGQRDVVPVSDPLIFSEAQRLSQVNTLDQRSKAVPGMYDLRKVEMRILKGTRIEDPEDLLTPIPKPQEANAVNENLMASLGRPIVAFPEQDHIAHLQTHLDYMASPVFGQNPVIAPKFIPIMLGHVAEHLALYYVAASHHAASTAAEMDVSKFLKDKDTSVKRKVDKLMSIASNLVLYDAPKNFERLMPVLQQAQQTLKAMMPPQPSDPTAVAMKEVEVRAQSAQMTHDVQVKKIAADAQRDQLRSQENVTKHQIDAQQRNEDAAQRAALAEQQRQDDAEQAAEQREQTALDNAADRASQEQQNREKLMADLAKTEFVQDQENFRAGMKADADAAKARADNEAAGAMAEAERNHDLKLARETKAEGDD